jgi:hypothetical protein
VSGLTVIGESRSVQHRRHRCCSQCKCAKTRRRNQRLQADANYHHDVRTKSNVQAHFGNGCRITATDDANSSRVKPSDPSSGIDSKDVADTCCVRSQAAAIRASSIPHLVRKTAYLALTIFVRWNVVGFGPSGARGTSKAAWLASSLVAARCPERGLS